MSKLSKTQRQILEVAAGRPDGAIFPLPQGLNLKGGALKATLASLIKHDLAKEQGRGKAKVIVITQAGQGVVRGRSETTKSRLEPQSRLNELNVKIRPDTKRAKVVALLTRPEGAGIAELIETTGWQPHSVRAALTGFRKRGIPVTRGQDETGVTIYRIAAE